MTVIRTRLAALAATTALAAISIAGGAAAASATPASPSPTAPATSTTAPSGTKVAWLRTLRADDRVITTAQLRALYDDISGTPVDPVQEELYVDIWSSAVGCLAGKGFYADPRIAQQNGSVAEPAANRAMYGDDRSGTYRWWKAGCWGIAVHVNGNDGGH